MTFSIALGAKHYLYEVLQFVGLVVVGFWVILMAPFSIATAISDGAALSELMDVVYSVLFYASLWTVPALIVVAAHAFLLRVFYRRTKQSVHPWIAATVLLPLAPLSLFWWGSADPFSLAAMLALSPLLFVYGWRSVTVSERAGRSLWQLRVERLGLILGLAYSVSFAGILAVIWVEALM
jgi:hypothetical protein